MIYLPESDRLKAIALCDQIESTIARMAGEWTKLKEVADKFARENADIIEKAKS